MGIQPTIRTIYLDTSMGASGDMLQASLYELLSPLLQKQYLDLMNAIAPNHLTLVPISASKCDIRGTHMVVNIDGEEEFSPSPSHHHSLGQTPHLSHHHHSYLQILDFIEHLELPPKVLNHAKDIYTLLGQAEASVHNSTLTDIHFHEVGSMDAIMDIVGCSLLFYLIDADQVISSPVHVGRGHVKCAHGILPIPAPATAQLLLGIPSYANTIDGELCTPTGAALLKHFVRHFGDMPIMTTSAIGYGLGTKDFPIANCLRAFLGTINTASSNTSDQELVVSIQCNIDDMTGEALGFAMEQLFNAGALDVSFTPIYMKKNRPGHLITCLAPVCDQEKFIRLLLECTTTKGVRYQVMARHVLKSSVSYQETPLGKILMKTSSDGITTKQKYEYQALVDKVADKSFHFDGRFPLA